MTCLTIRPEPLAVLRIGLRHREELSDGPHAVARASGGTMYRFMAQGEAE